VGVAESDAEEAGIPADFGAELSMLPEGAWEITHVEMRIVAQEGIGNARVEVCHEVGQVRDFGFINVARNQQSAGNEERGIGPFERDLGEVAKILEGSFVRHAGHGKVHVLTPCFQVELDTPAGFKTQLSRSIEKARTHAAVGFPADPENLSSSLLAGELRGSDGVFNLRCGVSPEIADATGRLVDRSDQFLDRMRPLPILGMAEMPVLAKETIEGAGAVKNSEILVTPFGAFAVGVLRITGVAAARTNPISNTIGGKIIVIPLDEGTLLSARKLHELLLDVLPDSAIPHLSFPEGASVHAYRASDAALGPRDNRRKTKLRMIFSVCSHGGLEHLLISVPEAIYTNRNGF